MPKHRQFEVGHELHVGGWKLTVHQPKAGEEQLPAEFRRYSYCDKCHKHAEIILPAEAPNVVERAQREAMLMFQKWELLPCSG